LYNIPVFPLPIASRAHRARSIGSPASLAAHLKMIQSASDGSVAFPTTDCGLINKRDTGGRGMVAHAPNVIDDARPVRIAIVARWSIVAER
jgi:hypothetical protein